MALFFAVIIPLIIFRCIFIGIDNIVRGIFNKPFSLILKNYKEYINFDMNNIKLYHLIYFIIDVIPLFLLFLLTIIVKTAIFIGNVTIYQSKKEPFKKRKI